MERSKGFDDRAVIGGLDSFLKRWSGPAQQALSDAAERRAFKALFADATYATWDKPARQAWVEAALAWLDQKGTADRSEGKAPPRVSPPPASAKRHKDNVPHLPPPISHLSLDSPLSAFAGVGPALAARFAKLGVTSVRDLLFFFPHRHLDYSQTKPIAQLEADKEQTVVATVWESRAVRLGRQFGAETVLGDETGNIRAVWFNQPYLAKKLPGGARVVLSGRVSIFKGMKQFDSPEWELLDDQTGQTAAQAQSLVHTGRLVPIYPLTQGLTVKRVRLLVKETVDRWSGEVQDFLPGPIRERQHLLALPQAIQQAHYPDSLETKEAARKRLAFNELFTLQLGLLSRKWKWQESQPGQPLPSRPDILNRFLTSLPFALTPAQDRVLKEVLADMTRTKPMSRLLQGEVGSGKTVVATAALVIAAANGFQGALMAPTEILAEQHMATLRRLLSALGDGVEEENGVWGFPGLLPRPLNIALLSGNVKASGKRGLHNLLRDGKIDVVVGTHALIQKDVEFDRLGLTVVDEQHRFGVRQRWELRQKGFNPHVLVMTATPIPRTLALTLYGDLDISVIDQLPPGRQEIKTRWLGPDKRQAAYGFLRKQIAEGSQAFIICPLIEESEAIEARAATAEYERLRRTVFPDLKLGLLHGRMSGPDKDDVMRRFRNGELHILVSTPVVEVGIDVPNATVMFVEAADRFGLSQLHQFRGRVGRGDKASYCILLAENPSPEARERLAIIEKVRDGFQLADEDLRLRGPGEFFGVRQSGTPELRMARLSDVGLLETARQEARDLFAGDPGLAKPEHQPLVGEMARLWRDSGEGS
ncbi:MAG: ATP-dependent DNA helicase RecG [Chloroflexi bacterium]|nr:ATP-dependent DNA helicase RecG [Chloroflexota bacterium]